MNVSTARRLDHFMFVQAVAHGPWVPMTGQFTRKAVTVRSTRRYTSSDVRYPEPHLTAHVGHINLQ